MRKILKLFFVIQEKADGSKRINPYNPLSYVVIIGCLIIGILAFGLIGVWKEVDINFFKWQ